MSKKTIIGLCVGLIFGGLVTYAVVNLSADPTEGVTGAQTGQAKRVTDPKAARAQTLVLSTDNTLVSFTGSSKLGPKTGYFTELEGEAGLDKDHRLVTISAALDMASVATDTESLTRKLKEEVGFFLVEKFPTATFVSTAITALDAPDDKGHTHTVEGNFKLKNLEQSLSFPARVTSTGKRFELIAEFSMKRLEWGVDYDGGTVFPEIRDNVLINLEITVEREAVSGAE